MFLQLEAGDSQLISLLSVLSLITCTTGAAMDAYVAFLSTSRQILRYADSQLIDQALEEQHSDFNPLSYITVLPSGIANNMPQQ
jgi:hypothetical protein